MITGKSIELQSVANGYIVSSAYFENPHIYLKDIEVLRFVERFFKMADINISKFEPDTNEETEEDNKVVDGEPKDRQELLLAALAPASGTPHSPVQVQKLVFLIDKNVPELIDKMDNPFNFKPEAYGPYDGAVYRTLVELEQQGLVFINKERAYRLYGLTVKGQKLGEEKLGELPEQIQDYFRKLSNYVRSMSFRSLVSAIYKKYPEMRENSVFR